ncbi:uncharacterized protein LOC128212521 [Mya arenaria]|uniref:uncharacterized protein LOC128212521 n=1 Tax=Mya arenaria TaxID=6604 RepID=UPI0022E0CD55|nr:uncharacterized protein LOC128212521 [Mya arenaria]
MATSTIYRRSSKTFYIYDIPIKKVVHVICGDVMEFAKDNTCIVIPCVVKSDGTRESRGELFECLKKEGGEICLEELNHAPIHEKTGCILTSGGNLKVTIIHPTRAVGNDNNAEDNIFLNIFGSLKMAAKIGQTKIAFPFVFSGVAGINLKSCAYQYARALTEFSRSEDVSSAWQDIYLVEKNYAKFKQVSEYFDHLLPAQKSQVLQIPRPLQDTDDTIWSSENTSLKVTYKDIRNPFVHAIVCPEYKGASYGGVFSMTIKYAYHKSVEIAPLKKLCAKGRIVKSKCCGYDEYKPVKLLFHVRTPIWKDVSDSSQLDECVASIFRKLTKFEKDDIVVNSVALPLLGIVDVSNESIVRECCKTFANSVAKRCRDRDSEVPLGVYLVNNCETITGWLKEDINLHLGVQS